MNTDRRLSGVLHVLLHMAEHPGPMTSEALGRAMGANAAVVRRTLAGLRAGGLVRSEKGHGGGWTLARALDAVTVADIYEALGRPSLFAIGHRDADPTCLVEQSVNRHLDEALRQAQALLLGRMRAVTLADLSRDFRARLGSRAAHAPMEAVHG